MARLSGWLAKPDAEDLSTAGRCLRPDLTAHCDHQVFGDCQAEACTGQLAAAGGIDLVEPLEDPVPVLGRYTGSMVPNRDRYFAESGPRAHLDLRTGGRELGGIVQEVADPLGEFAPVGGDLEGGVDRQPQTILDP